MPYFFPFDRLFCPTPTLAPAEEMKPISHLSSTLETYYPLLAQFSND
jgi:hypothetical protein